MLKYFNLIVMCCFLMTFCHLNIIKSFLKKLFFTFNIIESIVTCFEDKYVMSYCKLNFLTSFLGSVEHNFHSLNKIKK